MMLGFRGYFSFNIEEVEEVCGQISSSARYSEGYLSKAKLRVLVLLPGPVVCSNKHEYLVVCNISHSAQPVPSHPDQSYNILLGLSQIQTEY